MEATTPVCVIEMIDWNCGALREELVRSLFLSKDASKILRIHPVDPSVKDYITWHFEISEKYSVKSGYRVFMDTKG